VISDRDLVALTRDRSPYTGSPISRERGEAWLAEHNRDSSWSLAPVPSCRCCGEPAWANLRCTKHQDRNPCAAEGCQRTSKANGQLRDDHTLCGEHWRAFVPPGSPTRRAFNRLARLAKRLGYKRTDRWPDELESRWWRLWAGVIRRVRRRADGHIDKAEIERLFGWGDKD
jgi:hypothetical protein